MWPDDVHSPFFPPKELRAAGDGSKKALYYAVLEAMDRQLGPLFDRIRRDERLRKNTLILVMSDNGPESGAGESRPLRAGKTWLYEGGVRSPLIVWGPGLVDSHAARSVNRASVLCALDVNRSLYTIARAPLPRDTTLDGEDLAGTLLGKSEQGRRAPIFWSRPPDRPGTKEQPNPDFAVRLGKWKLYTDRERRSPELYDVESDVEERHNVANEHPATVERLQQLVEQWRAEVFRRGKNGP